MLEPDQPFQCPHCGAEISVRLDSTAGRRQSFLTDCEVCCQTISIVAEFDGEDLVGFTVSQE